MADNNPRRVYDLDSEVATLKRKFPEFTLRLPGVRYTDAERELDRAEWFRDHETQDSTDGQDAERYSELPDWKHEPTTIHVPSMAFISDDALMLTNSNPPEAMRLHLGDEAYSAYTARGGSASVLIQILQRDQAAQQGE